MTGLTLTDSIAGDYLRVALSVDGGKLRHAGALAEALRGAFLIDFARIGRFVQGESGSELDTTPTGCDSADDLLHELDEHPSRTLECWIQRGVPHIHEVIAELLVDGAWTVERHGVGAMHVRYADAEPDRFAALAQTVARVAEGRASAADPRQASLAALGAVTGLCAVRSLAPVSTKLLHECGPLKPIVEEVVVFMQAAERQNNAAAFVNAQTAVSQIVSI